jgi:hypothetical protein
MKRRPSVGVVQKKFRFLPSLALVASLVLSPLAVRAATAEDVNLVIEAVQTFQENIDLIEKGGKAIASQPFEMDEGDYQRLQDYSRELDKHTIKPFAWSENVNPDEMFSTDAAVRVEALRKLNIGKADQETYLQDLRAERTRYAAESERWSHTSDTLGKASRVLEDLLDNFGVSVIDQLGGQKMLNSWVDISIYLTPLASEISTNAKWVANAYAKEIAYREQLLSNYNANLTQLQRMHESMRDASAVNDQYKLQAEKIAETFNQWNVEAAPAHPAIDKPVAEAKAAELHARLDERLKAANEREAARLAQVEQERKKQEQLAAAAAALAWQQQQQQAAAAAAQQQAAAAAAAQQAAAANASAMAAYQAQQLAQLQAAQAAAAQAQQAQAQAAADAARQAQDASMRAWAQQQQQQWEQSQQTPIPVWHGGSSWGGGGSTSSSVPSYGPP